MLKAVRRYIAGTPVRTPPPIELPPSSVAQAPSSIIKLSGEVSAEQMEQIRERFRIASASNRPPQVLPDPPVVVLSDDMTRWILEYHQAGEPAATIAAELAIPERQITAMLTDGKCTSLTTKHARCRLDAQPGSDRCAMPAHSHQRQP